MLSELMNDEFVSQRLQHTDFVYEWSILAELKEQVLAGNPGKSAAYTQHRVLCHCVWYC